MSEPLERGENSKIRDYFYYFGAFETGVAGLVEAGACAPSFLHTMVLHLQIQIDGHGTTLDIEDDFRGNGTIVG